MSDRDALIAALSPDTVIAPAHHREAVEQYEQVLSVLRAALASTEAPESPKRKVSYTSSDARPAPVGERVPEGWRVEWIDRWVTPAERRHVPILEHMAEALYLARQEAIRLTGDRDRLASLLEKLKPYSRHRQNPSFCPATFHGGVCDCGLSDLLTETETM